jgi:tetratricopeptide (TPR) repeat protein
VSHVLLFGTPSAGLGKASPFSFWKRQVRDMASDGEFITALRAQWNSDFAANPPFKFVTIAGDRDEFVPTSSSLDPFPEAHRKVVYGNHLEIVKPDDASHLGFKLAVKALCGDGGSSLFDTASLAIESRDFQRAISSLWPIRGELDDRGLVSLALALDSVGRREDSIQLLTDAKATGTDPLGVLAGRLKRRWLAESRRADAERAMALYQQGLERNAGKNPAQAFYHAINCAFMAIAFAGDSTQARDYARQALAHCETSGVNDLWRHATEGEAHLYLGDSEAALVAYARAIDRSPGPRQVASIYQQAVRAADLAGDEEAFKKLIDLFQRPRA